MVDLELHSNYVPGAEETIFDVDRRVSKRTCVIPILPNDRFLCSFQHIFAGEMFLITFFSSYAITIIDGFGFTFAFVLDRGLFCRLLQL